MRSPFNQRKHVSTNLEQRGCSIGVESASTFHPSAVERVTDRLGMQAYQRNELAFVASLTFSDHKGQGRHYACPIIAVDRPEAEAIALDSMLRDFPPEDGYEYHAVHVTELSTSEIEQIARTLPALNQLFGGVQASEVNQSEYADEPVWCDVPGCKREAVVWSPRNGGMNLCHKHHARRATR
jgi:hypothetical protein